MTKRCWDELYRAGEDIAEHRAPLLDIVKDTAGYFELPQSPEEEAQKAFLGGLIANLEYKQFDEVLDPPESPEATEGPEAAKLPEAVE